MELELWLSLVIWGSVMILALVIDLQTNDFVSLGVTLAALATAISSFFTLDATAQVLIFIGTSFILITFFFLFLKKKAYLPKDFNDQRVINKVFTVKKQNEKSGVFSIVQGGITWDILSNDSIKIGSRVKILKIEGNRLVAKLSATSLERGK